MFYGGQIGLAKVLERMQAFHKTYGEDFAPAPLLEKAVAEGKNYRELGF